MRGRLRSYRPQDNAEAIDIVLQQIARLAGVDKKEASKRILAVLESLKDKP